MIVTGRPDAFRNLKRLSAALLIAGSAPLAAHARDATPPAHTWIFAGILPASDENVSGTLTSDATGAAFEMRLSDGATCDGRQLEDDIGVIVLHEITCSDGRPLRARLVVQGGTDLRVFGTIGEQEFIVDAHLLDFDAPVDDLGRVAQPPALPPIPRRPVASP